VVVAMDFVMEHRVAIMKEIVNEDGGNEDGNCNGDSLPKASYCVPSDSP